METRNRPEQEMHKLNQLRRRIQHLRDRLREIRDEYAPERGADKIDEDSPAWKKSERGPLVL